MDATNLIQNYERLYGPFTHMAPNDKAIWTRYLMQGGNQFAPFTYDLRVGDGAGTPIGLEKKFADQWWMLTTKRIDALCIVDGVTRIIEVKQRAGFSAIGQLAGYKLLYDRTPGVVLPSEKWLVTDYLQPDMQHLIVEQDVHLVEVGT